jgi:hypothetical protein
MAEDLRSPDHGARTLAGLIRAKRPFFFARVGDGAIECIRGRGRAAHTCDGEAYTPELAVLLEQAIETLKHAGSLVFWGDWKTATAGSAPTYVKEWESLVDAPSRQFLNYESLLLMRESSALVDFYTAVNQDQRHKLYLGKNAEMAGMFLHCNARPNPGFPFHVEADAHYILRLLDAHDPEVILFGAGMRGFAAVVQYWSAHPYVTCIHLGSALDPLFGNKSRAGQLSQERAREILWRVYKSANPNLSKSAR